MQINDQEIKRILDQGMLTRSRIETETSMRKCQMFSEMAVDPSVKAFFKDQYEGLEDVLGYFNKELGELG